MRRYLHGWRVWLWALYKARTKKRGAGPQQWSHAFKTAACARWIVYGQHRGCPRCGHPNPFQAPRFMRDMLLR